MPEVCYFCGLERKESPVTYFLPRSLTVVFDFSVLVLEAGREARSKRYELPLCDKHLEQLIHKMKSQFEEIIEGRARI
jgi:hypothetical protein